MSPLHRRSFMAGIIAVPIAADPVLGIATARDTAVIDPFPGYHREIVGLLAAINASDTDDDTSDSMMARWQDIDKLARSTRPTTLPGAIACLEYARREHVQFNMQDGTSEDDPTDTLLLALLDGALGVLRGMGGAA